MMGRTLVLRQRKMLRGWIKWIPVVLIPFAVLFTHAWLNIQILRADYVLRELDKESKSLQRGLRRAREMQSVQQDPDTVTAQATRLAFITPKPGQREVIYYDPREFINRAVEKTTELAQYKAMPPTSASPPPPSLTAVPQTEPVPVPEVLEEAAPVVPVSDTTEVLAPSSVWVAVEEKVAETFVVPVESAVSTSVVLDLPPDEYLDEVPDEETEMDTLEVL